MVISSEPHIVTAGHELARATCQRKLTAMANVSDARPPGNASAAARLVVIEERLNEVIRRLDELNALMTTLNHVLPNRHRSAVDD